MADKPSAASAATAQQIPVQPAAALKPGYIPCPSCGATLPEAAINDHLDRWELLCSLLARHG